MPHDPGPGFRALHKPGDPFVLANAWDSGSARVLAALGAEAIGTTSAGHAFTLGRPDMGHVTRDEALAHAEELVRATALPVSGDFENGFGAAPDVLEETVTLSCQAGLAGISIEDTDLPGTGAYDRELAIERIRAAAAAARTLPRDFVLVARADGVMNGAYNMEEALARARAFADAGADCVYVPVLPDMAAVARLCAAVDVPVNALASGRFKSVSKAEFAAAGVARISLGAALAGHAHTAFVAAAQAILDNGNFSKMDAAPDTDALLIAGRPPGAAL